MSHNKRNIVVLFGGKSPEHEVSVVTAFQALEHFDREKYNVFGVYIDPQGTWMYHKDLQSYQKAKACLREKKSMTQVTLCKKGEHVSLCNVIGMLRRTIVPSVDVVFPMLHGGVGEDGSLQGLLETLEVPFVGCDHTASAVNMDKIIEKNIWTACSVPIVPWAWFSRTDWNKKREAMLQKVDNLFTYNAVVKPASLGSSIAVTKVSTKDACIEAIDQALQFDDRVIVEKAITQLQEINCSVIGDQHATRASVCEEPLTKDAILSFKEKYLTGGKKLGGMADMGRKIPAPISDAETKRVQELAQEVFNNTRCNGLVRVDFLIDRADDTIYVNEINTLPGSLSFYLWEATGRMFTEVIDELISLAFKRHTETKQLVTHFESDLLEQFLAH